MLFQNLGAGASVVGSFGLDIARPVLALLESAPEISDVKRVRVRRRGAKKVCKRRYAGSVHPLREGKKTSRIKTCRRREKNLKAGGSSRRETEPWVLDIRACTPSAGRCNSRYHHRGAAWRQPQDDPVAVRDLMNRPGRITRDPSGAVCTAGEARRMIVSVVSPYTVCM